MHICTSTTHIYGYRASHTRCVKRAPHTQVTQVLDPLGEICADTKPQSNICVCSCMERRDERGLRRHTLTEYTVSRTTFIEHDQNSSPSILDCGADTACRGAG